MKLGMLDESFGEILRAEFTFVTPLPQDVRLRDQPVQIQRLDDGNLELRATEIESPAVLVAAQGRHAERFLDRIVDGGAAALVWVLSTRSSGVTVQGHLLRLVRPIPHGLTVMLGPHASEDLRPYHLRGENLASAVGDELALSLGDGKRLGFLVALSTRAEDQSFFIHGPRFNLEVRQQDGRPVLFRVVKPTRNRPALTWLAGPVRFVEGDNAARCDDSTFAQLSAIRKEGNYLERWRRYNDIERRLVVERAQKRGMVRYQGMPRLESRDERKLLVFSLAEPLTDSLAQLSEESELRLAALDRQQFERTGLTQGHYFSHWMQSREERMAVADERQRLCKGVALGRPILIPADDMCLAIEVKGAHFRTELPADGWLAVDLHGETVRLDRRERAISVVEDHRARIPRLFEMLEGASCRYGVARRRPVGSIATVGVLEAMKQSTINASQRRAIEIALRTPDIALILGPPGTGKTAVIRAIVRRLGELDREHGVRTRVLLTAFQHDAVDEVLKDITLCGMSGMRVGGPAGNDSGSAEELRLAIAEEWARSKIQTARSAAARLPEEPVVRAYQSAMARFLDWRSGYQDQQETRRAITDIEDQLRPYLDKPTLAALAASWRRQEARAAAQRSAALAPEDEQILIERLAGLRCTAESFADDGPRQAERLQRFLATAGLELAPEQQQLLEQVCALPSTAAPDATLLTGLAELQREQRASLLSKADTAARGAQPDPEAEAAMRRAIEQAGQRVQRSQAGARAALEDFAQALSMDLPGLADTMARYAQALGATCQQSVRAGVEREEELGEHDVVIVDEAARANPLDLLIPLVRGARLILVGDPNQLPHVLEKQVEDELEQDGSSQAKDILQESLFERLGKFCARWEAEDGIPRTVQLNEQYRMHPELGGFVSRHFYERRERDEAPSPGLAIKNGIKAPSLRQHRHPTFAGKVAAWIDVPWRRWAEQRRPGSSSRMRTAEVDRIKRLVTELRAEDPEASIGVITFYKDQAVALARQLNVGLGEGDKLRVGTVDAFQGRQFDVVILSTVRANGIRGTDDEARLSRIGFLELRNRLCVALSRARCLLLVVGCKETVAGISTGGSAAPESACWQLTRFYEELCAPGRRSEQAS